MPKERDINKNDVYNFILEYGKRDPKGRVPKKEIREKFGVKRIAGKLKEAIDELIKEGKIKEDKDYYYLVNEKTSATVTPQNDLDYLVKKLKEELITAFSNLLEAYFGKPKTTEDLLRYYETMKDKFGFVTIKNLRIRMGMTLEEFMRRFGDYIEENFELIAGGDEGFIKNGSIYGIIRRKR